jgi:hypothetical protein
MITAEDTARRTPGLGNVRSSGQKRSDNRDLSLKRMCCQVWSLQRRRERSQASRAVLWRCLKIGPTTGHLARSPDSRSLLRTVWPELRTFPRPGVLRAVSSAIIIRFRRWIRRKCLHTWKHILFSDKSRLSLRFSDGCYRVYLSRGKRFTDQCVYESLRLKDYTFILHILVNLGK